MLRAMQAMIGLAVAFSIAGCTGLLDSNEPMERVYWLEPFLVEDPLVVDGERSSLSLRVSAAPGLDSDRLLILGPDARLNYYAAARWPDYFPEVIASLLQSTLESTGQYSRVVTAPESVSTDWKLELAVHELYALERANGEPSFVRMLLRGHASCLESYHPILLQAEVAIADNQLREIVAAYQVGVRNTSQQLVDQLSVTCSVTDGKRAGHVPPTT